MDRVADGRPIRGWSIAFGITPDEMVAYPDGPILAMTTSADGLSGTGLPRLLSGAVRLGIEPDVARECICLSARHVAQQRERLLRERDALIQER
ncbi:hypothetical protein ACG02S_24070 [Roseateles sp. DC23W]|uniref:Uncharacterized protein n=1 Tax=Pelomonas dachongensis TaxID=3299029 RepID=A0ABW7EVW9_9BURK